VDAYNFNIVGDTAGVVQVFGCPIVVYAPILLCSHSDIQFYQAYSTVFLVLCCVADSGNTYFHHQNCKQFFGPSNTTPCYAAVL
jgi:hypothetical protein